MTTTTQLPVVMPELFSCERLSARLTVKACGARFLRVRAAKPGGADYDSACSQCPVGEHHAKHGTVSPNTQVKEPMTAPKTESQQRAAVRRVLVDQEDRAAVAEANGVSVSTIYNWIKRWGTDVASDAMEAAAGKGAGDQVTEVAKKPAQTTKQKAARAPRASTPRPEADAPTPQVSSRGAAVGTPATANEHPASGHGHGLTAEQLDELGSKLGAQVRFVADPTARDVVASAAWALTQAARCA